MSRKTCLCPKTRFLGGDVKTLIFRTGTFGGQIPSKTSKILYYLIKKIFQSGLCIYFLGNMKKKFMQNLFRLCRFGLEQVVNCIFCNFAYFFKEKMYMMSLFICFDKINVKWKKFRMLHQYYGSLKLWGCWNWSSTAS